jgi:hypothetical protein
MSGGVNGLYRSFSSSPTHEISESKLDLLHGNLFLGLDVRSMGPIQVTLGGVSGLRSSFSSSYRTDDIGICRKFMIYLETTEYGVLGRSESVLGRSE